jgi:hypothetical protein
LFPGTPDCAADGFFSAAQADPGLLVLCGACTRAGLLRQACTALLFGAGTDPGKRCQSLKRLKDIEPGDDGKSPFRVSETKISQMKHCV